MDEKGALVVEFFDYSKDAHNHFGNDIAYSICVSPQAKNRLFDLLADALPDDPLIEADDALLRALQGLFANYFDILGFLEANSVPFTKSYDPWA